MREISILIRKEFISEWRQRYALNGILLYLVSSIFVVYLTFRLSQSQINPYVWNALFWIIILFTSVSAVAKSFLQDQAGKMLYYYTIANPVHVIFSKILYNGILMLFLALSGFLIYVLLMGNPVINAGLFLVTVLLASLGFSSTLSMVSGIASKAPNNTTLMAVLSFPVVIPILLMVIKVSGNALNGFSWASSLDELLVLAAINMMVIAVSYLLFPYLWRS